VSHNLFFSRTSEENKKIIDDSSVSLEAMTDTVAGNKLSICIIMR
jgi:hypothetical protein